MFGVPLHKNKIVLRHILKNINYMAIFVVRFLFMAVMLSVACVTGAQERLQSGLPTFRGYNSHPQVMGVDDSADWRISNMKFVSLVDSANIALRTDASGRDFFSYLVNLILSDKVAALEYDMASEGDHVGNIADIRKVLQDNDIQFSDSLGKVEIKNLQSVSADIEAYYIIDGEYYDVTIGVKRHGVYAICPVMVKYGDINESVRFPLFWVRCRDIEPFINTWFTENPCNEREFVPLSIWLSTGKYKECSPEDLQNKKEG